MPTIVRTCRRVFSETRENIAVQQYLASNISTMRRDATCWHEVSVGSDVKIPNGTNLVTRVYEGSAMRVG